MGDAVAIKNQIPLIKSVSPNVDGSIQIIYGNQNWYTGYRGVSPEYFDIKRWYVDQGAVFSQDDVDRAADVCAIGRTVRDQLFGAEDPIGKVIRVRDLPCDPAAQGFVRLGAGPGRTSRRPGAAAVMPTVTRRRLFARSGGC